MAFFLASIFTPDPSVLGDWTSVLPVILLRRRPVALNVNGLGGAKRRILLVTANWRHAGTIS